MERVIEREWLDELPVDDPREAESRRDIGRLNRIMGHYNMMRGMLEEGLRTVTPKRIVELGAGDGTFMLRLARELSKQWPGVEVMLVDCKELVSPTTRAEFESLGWQLNTTAADVLDWLRGPAEATDAVIANLFLHHFNDEQLKEMLELVSVRARMMAACEPRRGWLPLWFSRMTGLIGCNAVTRKDAVLSVQAGFKDTELSSLWNGGPSWRLREQPMGLFTHTFLARSG